MLYRKVLCLQFWLQRKCHIHSRQRTEKSHLSRVCLLIMKILGPQVILRIQCGGKLHSNGLAKAKGIFEKLWYWSVKVWYNTKRTDFVQFRASTATTARKNDSICLGEGWKNSRIWKGVEARGSLKLSMFVYFSRWTSVSWRTYGR